MKHLALALFLALSGANAQPTYQDTARILAGLPVTGSLEPLTKSSAWAEHAKFFDAAWGKLVARQLLPINTWSHDYLPDAYASNKPVFYVFSGPDLLYAHTFFPNSSAYVLCGIEPVGSLPDLARVPSGLLPGVLHNIEVSVNSALNLSFFITKEMRVNLQTGPINGTLPILYVFLARLDCVIQDVQLTKNSVKITFSKAGGATQTLYYFCTDLSDGAKNREFYDLCNSLGEGTGFTKSASYLMHQRDFSQVRKWLLDHCLTIVQDDSGVPLADFDPARWRLRLFGQYSGPINLFKQHFQPDLAALYKSSNAPALGFGIGYRGWDPRLSTLIAAFRR